MKHFVVYFKEGSDFCPQFSIIRVEDNQNERAIVVKAVTEIFQSIDDKITDADIKNNLLAVEYFQVDSRVVSTIEEVVPVDQDEWKAVISDGGLKNFGLFGILDVLKAFKSSPQRCYTEEELIMFMDTK